MKIKLTDCTKLFSISLALTASFNANSAFKAVILKHENSNSSYTVKTESLTNGVLILNESLIPAEQIKLTDISIGNGYILGKTDEGKLYIGGYKKHYGGNSIRPSAIYLAEGFFPSGGWHMLDIDSNIINNSTKIVAGSGYTPFIISDNKLWVVFNADSYANYGQTGVPDIVNGVFTDTGLTDIVDIYSDRLSSIAIDSHGDAWVAGNNYYHQLGHSSPNNITTWTKLSDFAPHIDGNIIKASIGWKNSFILTDKGNLYAAGENKFEVLGANNGEGSADCNSSNCYSTYTLTATNVIDVASKQTTAVILKNDGKLYYSGLNSGVGLPYPTYTKSSGWDYINKDNIKSIVAYDDAIFAIDNNDKLISVGENNYGQLAQNIPVSDDVLTWGEVSIPFNTLNPQAYYTNGKSFGAIDEDGYYWGLGYNQDNRLGLDVSGTPNTLTQKTTLSKKYETVLYDGDDLFNYNSEKDSKISFELKTNIPYFDIYLTEGDNSTGDSILCLKEGEHSDDINDYYCEDSSRDPGEELYWSNPNLGKYSLRVEQYGTSGFTELGLEIKTIAE